jgi:hypothetical protein
MRHKLFYLISILFCLVLLILNLNVAHGNKIYNPRFSFYKSNLQLSDTTKIGDTTKNSIAKINDTLLVNDTLQVNDSLQVGDTLSVNDSLIGNPSSLKFPVFSTARDSIVEDFSNGKTMIYYYGDVTVKYDNMQISAEYMAYNVDTKTVFAKGLPDLSDTTGKTIKGSPVMSEGDNKYEMESVYYNFDSRKAKIKNMTTQEDEGFLRGQFLKKMPDNSINISKGRYSTCEYDHFYLNLTAAKVINSNGGKKTVFGPAYVVIEDVPTPFALPFGFVPQLSSRSSGLLIPSYGEENARGFFLRGLGYYFVFGDHFDLAVTGDIYSRGSWATQVNSRYNKRYKYTGNVAMNYSVDKSGEKGSPDFFETKNFSVQWSHSQDSKARPGTTFRASVNFSSPSNSRYNSTSISQALQNQISSSISYGKSWSGTPFSLTVNGSHSQNSLDSSYAITLPNITFTVNRIYPFKRKERVGKEKFYESFAFNYSTTFDNKINFKSSEFGKPGFLDKLKNGMRHNFSIGLPTFSILKYITASPGVTYGMNWYFTDATKYYDQEKQTVVTEYSDPFSTFGLSQNFSSSLSLSTRIYGMFDFGKDKALKAIRHMITPSLSFSYQPEMGVAANGYTTLDYVDANGVPYSIIYNKYENQINSPPGRGKNASMSLSIGNNLEAKVRDKNDTTGKGERKIKLIDQLNISTGYNFLADSLKLSNINMNMSTSVFGKLAINASASFDPYAVDNKGRKINTYNIVREGGFKLARLTSASIGTSYSFQGDGKSRWGSDYTPEGATGNNNSSGSNNSNKGVNKGNSRDGHSAPPAYQRYFYDPETGAYVPGGWVYYTDPSVPWSVNFNLNYSYSSSYQYANEQLLKKNNHSMTLGISSQIKLTDALNFNMSTNFDLTKMKMSTTQLSGSYDLHCFVISFSWIPNGKWESWSFRINAKASALADLLQYKKNASYWDR